MRRAGLPWAGLALASVLASGASAQPDCDALGPGGQQRAAALFAELYIHDCCDQVLAVCLQTEPVCALADRIAANVCRRVAAGETDEAIQRAMALRSRTMLPGLVAPDLDLDGVPLAGDPSALVTVVEFADARGHHCARMTPAILHAVTDGPLAGKVRLALVLFPLRSNPHAREGALAFAAAHRQGRFWAFLQLSYERFDQFTPGAQLAWAEELGLDPVAFTADMADPDLLQQLSDGKLAGLNAGVSGTPTFFVEGRRYDGEMEPAELIDLLEEVHDRVSGRIHLDGGGEGP
jgi:protein-disulfide isomerase